MSTNVKNLPKSSLNLQIDVKILINKKGQIHKKESKELKAAKNYKLASKGIDEGIDELMCNSFKIKSLLYKLPLNRAAGKDGVFVEHIFYANSNVCNHLSSLFNVCLMHGKIPQECMQTVIVPICKNKNGHKWCWEL